MTLLSSILDSGGSVSVQRLTRLLRQSSTSASASASSSASASASESMVEPTTSQVLNGITDGGRVPSLGGDLSARTETTTGQTSVIIDRVTNVAKMALEATVMEVLPDPDPDQVLAGVNASAHWNRTLSSASATNYENCSALFANYTLPPTGETAPLTTVVLSDLKCQAGISFESDLISISVQIKLGIGSHFPEIFINYKNKLKKKK